MKTQDWGVRHRLERFLTVYERGGKRFDLHPAWIDGATPLIVFSPAGLAGLTTSVIMPGGDAPFLWIGNSFPKTLGGGNPDLRPTHEKMIRFTILKNGWMLGNAQTEQGLTGWIPLQTCCGFDGLPSLWPYPYLFEAHDQLRIDYLSDSSGNYHALALLGYKVLARP